MQKLVFVLLVAAAVGLAGRLEPVTALPEERPVEYSQEVSRPERPPAEEDGGFIVGTVDTVGGTTYDWQANGPIYRFLCNSPDYGIHVLWMYSASNQTAFADRNMRYNFYDYAGGIWNWIDPADFMLSGVNVYIDRAGYGSLATDTASKAVVSGHLAPGGGAFRPDAARDLAPGTGIFEYCSGSPTLEGYLWPPIVTTPNQAMHLAMIDDLSRNNIFYARASTWCNWENPVGVASPQPNPNFPDQNIATSEVSNKVCITWEFSEGAPDPGFYRESTDGGTTWGPPTNLPWPVAYGGDTATSYHITSLFPYYDRSDRLHIVAGVMPYVGATGYVIPAKLYHWCPENTPNWSLIHVADPDTLAAPVGYNATYACRPSMGEDRFGGLYVAWEEFDSLNYEPGPPSVLRADIYYAQDNGDNGQTWGPGVRITDPSSHTCRFPSIIDYLYGDTLCIMYIIDQVAGFFVQGEGPATNNPVLVHKLQVTTGIEEERRTPVALGLAAAPNPFSGQVRLDYALPRPARVGLEVYDLNGRLVTARDEGNRPAGRYSVRWLADDLSPGVYVARLRAGDQVLTEKLVLTAR